MLKNDDSKILSDNILDANRDMISNFGKKNSCADSITIKLRNQPE
jgi:hypothetical protein